MGSIACSLPTKNSELIFASLGALTGRMCSRSVFRTCGTLVPGPHLLDRPSMLKSQDLMIAAGRWCELATAEEKAIGLRLKRVPPPRYSSRRGAT